jgi:hypothetical protein
MEKLKMKEYTKAELYEAIQQPIDEGWGENALLLAGFLPVIGDIADIILIIKYVREKRYIEAGLMLFALVPIVGQALVTPIIRAGKEIKGAFSGGEAFAKFLTANPKLAANYAKAGKYFNHPKINQLIGQVGKIMPKAAEGMNEAKGLHVTLAQKFAAVEEKGLGRAVKDHFQGQSLQKYLIKTGGVEPANWLSRWWNVVYKGRQGRRQFINKIILGDNALHSLGIFSIEGLEDKMSHRDEAEKLAQNPAFADFYNKVTSPEDMKAIESGSQPTTQQSSTPGIGGAIGTFMGINALKSLARFV